MVFIKPSTMSRAALSRLTEGKMTTLLSADTQSFLEVAIHSNCILGLTRPGPARAVGPVQVARFAFFHVMVPYQLLFAVASLAQVVDVDEGSPMPSR